MNHSFAKKVLNWYHAHGRKTLPWQHPRSAYYVWLSEIMLQQTQVTTVIPYFEKFVERFPDIKTLANASLDEVLASWAGLGYYSRARNLHSSAKLIQTQYQGSFPSEFEQIIALPGIGKSTAGAILAQAFGKFGVILDGNVRRILCRYHAIAGDVQSKLVQEKLWQIATESTPQKHITDYTQGIMDLGALICTRSKPKCHLCPVKLDCKAFNQQLMHAYPSAKKTKPLPRVSRIFLIMLNKKGQVFLQQQATPGIWAGLWSIPSVADEKELVANISASLLKHKQDLPSVRHAFSHYKLNLHLVLFKEVPSAIAKSFLGSWIAISDLAQYGMPAPIKKILMNINNQFLINPGNQKLSGI